MEAFEQPTDHDARLAAARERALWELGDAEYADVILAAYEDPAADARLVTDERANAGRSRRLEAAA